MLRFQNEIFFDNQTPPQTSNTTSKAIRIGGTLQAIELIAEVDSTLSGSVALEVWGSATSDGTFTKYADLGTLTALVKVAYFPVGTQAPNYAKIKAITTANVTGKFSVYSHLVR